MSEKESVIISIDAGGSSTRYFVIGNEKNVLKKYKTGSGSPAVNLKAEEDIFHQIELIIQDIKQENAFELKGIIIGMSGFALVNEKAYQKKLEDAFGVKVILMNDAMLALYSVLQDKYDSGVVAISGTGAIILAKNKNQTFYANGWGELLTERGSGYAIVKDYVCNMIHHNEQRGYYSPFENKLLDYLGFKTVEEFKMLFYRHKKNEVARICDFFVLEAQKGDEEAKAWLYENGTLLGIDIISAINRVGLHKNEKVIVGLRGGFMEGNPNMVLGIKEKLKEEDYNVCFSENEQPIFGGYYLAKVNGLLE